MLKELGQMKDFRVGGSRYGLPKAFSCNGFWEHLSQKIKINCNPWKLDFHHSETMSTCLLI